MGAYLITRQNDLRNTLFCANVRRFPVKLFILAGLRVHVNRTIDYVSDL
jgi:hypothetical protein